MAEERGRAVRLLSQRAVTWFGLGMFFFIGHETGAGWWIWPVFGMGISLVIQASRVFFADPASVRDAAERRAEKRMSRRERRRLQREERLADFERKVTIGADALVHVIDEARNAKDRIARDVARAARDAERMARDLELPGRAGAWAVGARRAGTKGRGRAAHLGHPATGSGARCQGRSARGRGDRAGAGGRLAGRAPKSRRLS